MSQRPPKKSGKNPSRRNRKKAPTSPPQMKAAAAGAAGTASADATAGEASRATRSSERRNARRIEAQKKAKQKKQMQLLGGGVAVAVVVAILLILVNRPSNDGLDIDYSGIAFAPPPVTQAQGAGTPAASPEADASTQPYTGATLGDPDAPVTMVIYADYQCPFCRLFAAETQPKIIEDFVRPGKVRLEFREFPVLGGPDISDDSNESAQSAEAVLCAAEQDSYLDYHDKLYANQRGENQGNFSDKRLKQFADELGLDTGAFNECLDSGRYEAVLQQAKDEGTAQGITATPMFVINGNVTQMTDQGYDLLKKQLEAAVETAQ